MIKSLNGKHKSGKIQDLKSIHDDANYIGLNILWYGDTVHFTLLTVSKWNKPGYRVPHLPSYSGNNLNEDNK